MVKRLKNIFIFIGEFITAILFRVFLIEINSIPSGSMKDTLFPGDKVLVNKLVYGPKLPSSPYEIPWVNLIWFLIAKLSIILIQYIGIIADYEVFQKLNMEM